jgi:hypothetical protein
MCFAGGRFTRHPRAAHLAWRRENGRALHWFHVHGGRALGARPDRRTITCEDRKPVWFRGGVEADSPRGKVIRWSQPEVALYDGDPFIRMSYPGPVEDG